MKPSDKESFQKLLEKVDAVRRKVASKRRNLPLRIGGIQKLQDILDSGIAKSRKSAEEQGAKEGLRLLKGTINDAASYSRKLKKKPLVGTSLPQEIIDLLEKAGEFATKLKQKRKEPGRKVDYSSYFDAAWYEKAYPETRRTDLSPLDHYLTQGWKEGRRPCAWFDPAWYLNKNPDVQISGVEPLTHFLKTGAEEGRLPSAVGFSSVPVNSAQYQKVKMHAQELAALFGQQSAAAHHSPPGGRLQLLCIVHEATETGAPRALLETVSPLVADQKINAWFFIMKDGPLVAKFSACGPTVTQSQIKAQKHCLRPALAEWFRQLPGQKSVLANSAVTATFCNAFTVHDIPVLMWVHESPLVIRQLVGDDIMKAAITGISRFLFPSHLTRLQVSEAYNLDDDQTAVVRLGADHMQQASTDVVAQAAATVPGFKIAADDVVILACGTVDMRKGPDHFINFAHNLLRQTKGHPALDGRLQFIWLGSTADKMTVCMCLEDCKKMGIAGRVHFVGHHSDTSAFYRRASLLAMTSRDEPVGLVGFEALLHDMPVVQFSGVSGLDEYVSSGIWQAPYGDVEAMAKIALDLLASPQQFRDEVAKAKTEIQENLTWSRTADAVLPHLLESQTPVQRRRFDVLVISNAAPPVFEDGNVEGGALRCWGLASAVKKALPGAKTALAYMASFRPGQCDVREEGVLVTQWASEDALVELAKDAAVVIVSYCLGGPALRVAGEMASDQFLVLDCYVPAYVEVSARRSKDLQREYASYMSDIVCWNKTLARGNLFICANKEQQHMYAGALGALGILNPVTYAAGNLEIIPYGVSDSTPTITAKPCTERLRTPNAWKLLWFGGLYPWFDITVLADALKHINETHPCELFIVGAVNPFVDHPDFNDARDSSLGYLKKSEFEGLIHLLPWVSYKTRADWYCDADIIITINQAGLENEFAWRTRLVDYLWADTIIATNGGDPLSNLLFQHDAAVKLDELKPEAIAAKIISAIRDEQALLAMKERMHQVRESLRWSRIIEPLAERIRPLVQAAEEQGKATEAPPTL